jgi:hypothetical protein
MALTSTDPLAPNAARELGAACKQAPDGTYHISDVVTQTELDQTIADMRAQGVQPTSLSRRSAYDNLQSEGNGRDFS